MSAQPLDLPGGLAVWCRPDGRVARVVRNDTPLVITAGQSLKACFVETGQVAEFLAAIRARGVVLDCTLTLAASEPALRLQVMGTDHQDRLLIMARPIPDESALQGSVDRLTAELEGARAELARKTEALQRLAAQAEQSFIADELTGLYNRHGFLELGQREVMRAWRFGRPLAVVLCAVDDYERLLEHRGSAVAEAVLSGVARRLRRKVRATDLLGRYGPAGPIAEALGVLLTETTLDEGSFVAERLRSCIEEAPFDTPAGELSQTLSLGLTELASNAETLEQVLSRAETGLLGARQAGRNGVGVAAG